MNNIIEVKTDLRKFNKAKEQVQKAIQAMDMKVDKPEHLQPASEVMGKVKIVQKMIEDKRKELTKPLYDGQKKVNQAAKDITDGLDKSLREFKSKILTVQQAEMKRIEDERIKKEAEAEKLRKEQESKIEPDFTETEEVVEEIREVKKEEKELGSMVKTRKVWKFKVTDEKKIPRAYMTPDVSLIRSKLPTGDQEPIKIPGIEFYQDVLVC